MRLEPFADEHLPSLDVLFTDPVSLRFTRIPEPPPPGFGRLWLDSYEAGRREGTREVFAAVDDDGTFLGLALAPEFDRKWTGCAESSRTVSPNSAHPTSCWPDWLPSRQFGDRNVGCGRFV